mmetsp:Transcript_17330/g.50672  ORF Transcript_17330/g.50672 Transcript_17330/m.50672 type:complete len:260 (+) Transcript_17330:113-892(+)
MGAAQGANGGTEATGKAPCAICCRTTSSSTGMIDVVMSPQRPMVYPDHANADDGGESRPDPLFADALAPRAEAQEPRRTGDPPGRRLGGGDGEETYEDGSSYRGQLVEGRRHGYGQWTSPGELYTGQWRNDHRDGQGRQTWQDDRAQRLYEGQFKAGCFDGHGRMEWTTPEGLVVYEGQYVNDSKHGIGRYSWPDGRVYDGQWRDGKRSGRATFTNSAGVKRDGVWGDDKVERWLSDPGGHSEGAWEQNLQKIRTPRKV